MRREPRPASDASREQRQQDRMSNLKSRLLDRIHSKNAVIGMVGLGYVGLPLVLRFAEAGYRCSASTSTPGRSTSSTPARATSSTSAPHADRRGARRRLRGDHRFLPRRRSRCADHLRADAARQLPRAGPVSYVVGTVDALLPHIRAGPAAVARKHHLSRHDRGRAAAAHRDARASRSARTSSSSFRRNAKTRQPEFRHPDHPEGRAAACTAGLPRRPAWRSTAGHRQGRAGQLDPRRRTDQAAGEHPSRGQHRPGQRDEDRRRQDGHRHPRGDPGRGDQAVRLRAVLSRARAWAATASRSIRST